MVNPNLKQIVSKKLSHKLLLLFFFHFGYIYEFHSCNSRLAKALVNLTTECVCILIFLN